MGRSILAITIGYVVSVVLVMTTFLFMAEITQSLAHGENANPELLNSIFIGVQFFSLLYAVVGGYVTARMIKKNKLEHGAALGAVMVGIALLTIVVEKSGTPPWWHIAFLALVIPCSVLGSWLNLRAKPARKS